MEERCCVRKEDMLRSREAEQIEKNLGRELDKIVEAAKQHLQK